MNINRSQGISTQLNQAQAATKSSLQKISTGQRINSAKDDAAGLVISSKLESQGRSGQAALRNTLDGTSRTQLESGALSSVTEDLQRIRELKVQQNNGLLNDQDKAAIQSEIDQRTDTIQSVFKDTQFNQSPVFKEGNMSFQTGADAGNRIELSTQDLAQKFQDIGIGSETDFDLGQIDEALAHVAGRQGELGAVENRLAANAQFLEMKNEANQASNSRIRDTDIAQTVSDKSKADVMSQVAISVQGQANISAKYVLNLLKS